jgi:hypothetical protein
MQKYNKQEQYKNASNKNNTEILVTGNNTAILVTENNTTILVTENNTKNNS